MSFKTISAILKSTWLIDQSWAEAHFPIISGIISGKFQLDAMKPSKGEMSAPFMVMPNGKSVSFFETTMSAEWGASLDTSRTNSKTQPGTVAVIPVIGPILKYDGSCGEAGSLTRSEWFKMANEDENVVAIIGYIDSPGGQVDGTATLADTIKSLSKPTFAVIDDGMMASAAMWIGSAFSQIFATQKTDSIGSIGVYCSFLDVSGWYEKQGVKVHTIYAPESTEKNLDFKEAMKGKYAMVEQDLSFLAQTFIDTIKVNRGDKLTSDKWNKGAMFYAEEAMEIGLIDGIKSFDEVVLLARNAAIIEAPTSNPTQSQKSNKNSDMKFPKIEALAKLPAAEVTQDMVNAAMTELAEAGIEGVSIVLESEQVTLATSAENADKLVEENKILQGACTELTSKVEALTALVNKPAEDAGAAGALDDNIPNSGGDPAYNVTSVDQEKARMADQWK